MTTNRADEGFEWQVEVWDGMAGVYEAEVDKRFRPVVDHVLARADPRAGETVLDLGTGTGAVAFEAAVRVGDRGRITAVDISPEMLARARAGAAARSLDNIDLVQGRGELIPAPDDSHDIILASLSLMYVIDRAAAAREIARVLRAGGRFVAAVWAGPEDADIVRLQQTAGSFAPTPPVKGVGPGALADPKPFLDQLTEAGLDARVDTETTEFEFDSFDSAWDVLAGVTTAELDPVVRDRAKAVVRELIWTDGDGPRRFSNLTRFFVATKSR